MGSGDEWGGWKRVRSGCSTISRFRRTICCASWMRCSTSTWSVSSSSRFYCEIGRPSVDPELMIRTLLIGYCYSIRSKRRLCDEVRLGLAYRWFCGLGLDAAVPHHVARRTMASLIGSACVWSMAGLRTVATILAVASTGGARQSVYSLWSWNAIGAQAPFSLEGAQCATRWAIHDA